MATPARALRSTPPRRPTQTPPTAPPEQQTVPVPIGPDQPDTRDTAARPPASPTPPEDKARRSPPGPPSARVPPPSSPCRSEVVLQPLPALVILVLPDLRLQRKLRWTHRQPRLKHEGQRVLQVNRL